MKPAVKYGIIAIAWVLFFVIGIAGNSETDVPQTDDPSHTESSQVGQTTNNSETTGETEILNDVLNNYIGTVVTKYNAQTTEQLVFVEYFTPSDKNSGHYRTEFRLNSFSNAVGKSYLLGDKVVDIVASQSYMGAVGCRVYTNDTSFEQVVALLKGFSPIMDETLSTEDLQLAIDEISKQKTANGYRFGKIVITLFGSDTKGYELMID